MEKDILEKERIIENKREKRANPVFFLKDLIDYAELLLEKGHMEEAGKAYASVEETYFHRGIESMIMHHVYSDFGLADRILALSDFFNGRESPESLSVLYYRAIDSIDGGAETDENAVYESVLSEMNSRRKGYAEEKIKVYRRYTSALRRAGREDEARGYEDKLFRFRQDDVWPLE